jgi:hypothetical protein
MSQCGGHETIFGPAAIAIHDDGNVLGELTSWLD